MQWPHSTYFGHSINPKHSALTQGYQIQSCLSAIDKHLIRDVRHDNT